MNEYCYYLYGMCFEGECYCVGMYVGDGIFCRGNENKWKKNGLFFNFLNNGILLFVYGWLYMFGL